MPLYCAEPEMRRSMALPKDVWRVSLTLCLSRIHTLSPLDSSSDLPFSLPIGLLKAERRDAGGGVKGDALEARRDVPVARLV